MGKRRLKVIGLCDHDICFLITRLEDSIHLIKSTIYIPCTFSSVRMAGLVYLFAFLLVLHETIGEVFKLFLLC